MTFYNRIEFPAYYNDFVEALENTVRAAACEQVPDLSLDGLIV